MHIGLILPGFSRDAHHWAIPVLQELAVWLAQRHEVTVFSLRYPAAGVYRFGNLTHIAVGGGTRARLAAVGVWAAGLRAVVRVHRQRPFHLLHAFWVDEPALVAGLAGHWIGRPVLASIGGGELVYLPDIGYGMQGSRLRRAMVRLGLRGAAVVTGGSHYALDLCRRQGVPEAKLRLIPLGVNTDRFFPRSTPLMARPPLTLVQAAGLSGVKNQALLLAVLRQVKTAVPVVRLILAGQGPLAAHLHRLAEQDGLAEQISWQPQVAYPEMPPVYGQGHLYVQTSRHESQGMAVLEALACGLPVVGTPVGVLPQVAAWSPGWTVAELAGGVLAMAETAVAATHRQQAHHLIATTYSLAVSGAQFSQLYAEYI